MGFLGPFWQFGHIWTGTLTSLYPRNFEDAHDGIQMYADELFKYIFALTKFCFSGCMTVTFGLPKLPA